MNIDSLKYAVKVKALLLGLGEDCRFNAEDKDFVTFCSTEKEITPEVCAEAIVEYRTGNASSFQADINGNRFEIIRQSK